MAANLSYPSQTQPMKPGYHVWVEDIPVFDYGVNDPPFDFDRAVHTINVPTIVINNTFDDVGWRCEGLSGSTTDQRVFCGPNDLIKYIEQMRKRGMAVQIHTVPWGEEIDLQIELTTEALQAMRDAGVAPRADLNYEPGFWHPGLDPDIPAHVAAITALNAFRLPWIQGIRAANPDAYLNITLNVDKPENYTGIFDQYVDGVHIGMSASHTVPGRDAWTTAMFDAEFARLRGLANTIAGDKDIWWLADPWEFNPVKMQHILDQFDLYAPHRAYIWRRGIVDGVHTTFTPVPLGPWDSWPQMATAAARQVRHA